MTSSEKIAELRRAILAAAAAPDADDKVAILLGAWRFLPGFARRHIVAMLPDVDDPAVLDDWLGLGAAIALQLRSDFDRDLDLETGDVYETGGMDEDVWLHYVDAAKLLLDRVRSAAPA